MTGGHWIVFTFAVWLAGCGRIELLAARTPGFPNLPDTTTSRPDLERSMRPPPFVPARGSPCTADSDCGPGRLCTGGRCGSCPDLADCTEPPSALGLVALVRNGCTLCDYSPRSECEADADCPVEGNHCYRGLRCIEGCTGTGCCINACSAPGCDEAVPLGCRLAPRFCISEGCLITQCSCATDRTWICGAVDATVPSSCEYSP